MSEIKLPSMIRYKCATCGNTCLQEKRPDNSVCGGCDKPDWKIMRIQESYEVGKRNWIHPDGEI